VLAIGWIALSPYILYPYTDTFGVLFPVLALTLIGLTLYVLLLEVWPRYLFLYAPFFVILASMAFEKPLSFKR